MGPHRRGSVPTKRVTTCLFFVEYKKSVSSDAVDYKDILSKSACSVSNTLMCRTS